MLSNLRANINNGRLALTIARRSMKRNRLQSMLIVLIIALPVIPGAFALTYFESQQPTVEERIVIELGQTQGKFQAQIAVSDTEIKNPKTSNVFQNPDDIWAFRGQLPDEKISSEQGTFRDPRSLDSVKGTWLSERYDIVAVKTETGLGNFNLVEGEPWNKAFEGMFEVTSGSVPKDESEVMVTNAALDRLGANLGDKLELPELQELRKIVGTIEDGRQISTISTIYALPGSISGVMPAQNLDGTAFYLVGNDPVNWQQVTGINTFGIGVLSRDVLLNPPDVSEVPLIAAGLSSSYGTDSGVALSQVASIAFLLPIVFVPVAILAGSAFSFGARRQVRTLAILSSLGARRRVLRFITVANGMWLGLLGGLVGAVVGLALAFILLPLLANGSRISYPGFHIPWLTLSITVISASFIGALASLIPAITASKVNVLETLRGVRLGALVKRRSGIGGVLVTAIGAAVTVVGGTLLSGYLREIELDGNQYDLAKLQLLQMMPVIGSIILVIGFLLITGWLLIAVRTIFRRFGVVANYSSNDLIYNRKRFQPVIASVIATSFVAATALGYVYTIQKSESENYVPRLAQNQIMVDPIWSTSVSDGRSGAPKPKEYYENAMSDGKTKLSTKLKIASAIAPIENAGIVSRHTPLSALGYEQDWETGLSTLGAEGNQPLLRVNPDLLCPWDPRSSDYEKYQALTSPSELPEKRAMEQDPKVRGCERNSYARETIFVGEAKDLATLLGEEPSAEAAAALNSGNAVSFQEGFRVSGKVYLDWYPSGTLSILNMKKYASGYDDELIKSLPDPQLTKTKILDAVYAPAVNRELSVMITPATADALGIDYKSALLIVNYLNPLTVAQTDQLNGDLNGAYQIDTGYPNDPEFIAWLILLIAGFFVIASTSIALGLAQIESRADQSTLGSIGAPRRFRSRVLALQAFILTSLGTILGSAAGYYLAYVVANLGQQITFKVALPQISLLVIGIPLLASLIFWLGTANRSTYRIRLALD